MGFFDKKENVDDYIKMVQEYDFSFVKNAITTHLSPGATLLEIGMGPGVDLLVLAQQYKVTGSDASTIFVDRFKTLYRDSMIPVLQLDARTLNIQTKFDCIYSNKVLMHLKKEEMTISLKRQSELLNDGGIIFATLWYGNSEEKYGELLFNYYNEKTIPDLLPKELEISTLERYTEENKDDSFYMILKKSVR